MLATRSARPLPPPEGDPHARMLDAVFFALSDPVRRAILERVAAEPALVSELAAPFEISLQAVSRHIQVLARAGLVSQERTGRIARCSLEVGPIFAAATWINHYSEYWQAQFDSLAAWLVDLEQKKARGAAALRRAPKRASAKKRRT